MRNYNFSFKRERNDENKWKKHIIIAWKGRKGNVSNGEEILALSGNK